MSTPHLFMWFVIVAVGIPSSWKNPTALALVMAWLAGEAIWLITGDNLPVEFYLFPDIFVISVIMSKSERSNADRAVLSVYPVMWVIYVAPIHPYYAWWALYWLGLAQFFAAGWEAFSFYRRDLGAAGDTPDDSGALLVAYEVGGYG